MSDEELGEKKPEGRGPSWENGVWFYRCDLDSDGLLAQFGYCENPDCIDPMGNMEKRKAAGVPTGRYWGADTKRLTCVCGSKVYLT